MEVMNWSNSHSVKKGSRKEKKNRVMSRQRPEKYRKITWGLGIVVSLCFVFILLITSFEIGAYSSWNFYQKEYEKYDVLTDVNMEMSDVMYVTKEMMAFLKGDREDLIVKTVVNGEKRNFFNEREVAHMEDVQVLFVQAMNIRMVAIGISIAIFVLFILLKMPWRRILPKAYQYTTLSLGGLTVILTLLIASDFDKYFTIFHELFFSNDLWLLDPDTSLLINILPQGFFVDMASRIGFIFGVFLVISFTAATISRILYKRKNK